VKILLGLESDRDLGGLETGESTRTSRDNVMDRQILVCKSRRTFVLLLIWSILMAASISYIVHVIGSLFLSCVDQFPSLQC
jgi:hypothetical protein